MIFQEEVSKALLKETCVGVEDSSLYLSLEKRILRAHPLPLFQVGMPSLGAPCYPEKSPEHARDGKSRSDSDDRVPSTRNMKS